MNEKLPRITADEIIHVLEMVGFEFSRQSGSHKIYKNPAGRRATVPYHKSTTLHPKVLNNILKDAELSREDLIRLLKGK